MLKKRHRFLLFISEVDSTCDVLKKHSQIFKQYIRIQLRIDLSILLVGCGFLRVYRKFEDERLDEGVNRMLRIIQGSMVTLI